MVHEHPLELARIENVPVEEIVGHHHEPTGAKPDRGA
jgi:hypothetical protein